MQLKCTSCNNRQWNLNILFKPTYQYQSVSHLQLETSFVQCITSASTIIHHLYCFIYYPCAPCQQSHNNTHCVIQSHYRHHLKLSNLCLFQSLSTKGPVPIVNIHYFPSIIQQSVSISEYNSLLFRDTTHVKFKF